MSERITEKQLETLVRHINELTGNPTEQHSLTDGRWNSNPGNFHIASAYGGYKLEQNDFDGHGVTSVNTSDFDQGYVSRRELYNQLRAFIAGLSYK